MNGHNPTLKIKELLNLRKLDPRNYLVLKEYPTHYLIQHRHSLTTRELRKEEVK